VHFGPEAFRPVEARRVLAIAAPSDPRVDAVLLEVERGEGVTPARIADFGPTTGAAFVAVGYGARDASGTHGFGHRTIVKMPAVDPNCAASRASVSGGCIPGLEFVLASNDGRDTCSGDSGGPLFAIHAHSGGYRLIGLTSRGFPAGAANACGKAGTYVDVRALKQWIEASTQRRTP